MWNCGEQGKQLALFKASARGHHACVSLLVANGADVNMASEVIEARGIRYSSESALYYWLVESLCHCDEQAGETALMLAALNGDHECVSILVANGATELMNRM